MAQPTRFSVPPLASVTRRLADVAAGRASPDLVITGARVLSSYTERLLPDREVWIASGRVAALKPAGSHRAGRGDAPVYDVGGGILAPGLVDPHLHIESSMVTACAYAEAALLNGTTTIFCDSHEIGNVMDVAGVEAMLEDARMAPLSIFLTVPSTVPATSPLLETAGGDLTADKIAALFDRWPEAVALGEKMDYVPVTMGDERSHAIIAAALSRGRPVSGHIYGRDFVAAYAASGITDTHEAIDRDIADDLLDAGVWIFLRGGPPTTPWHSLPEAIKAVTELGASTKRIALCTDDRDADDLLQFGLDWVAREAMRAGLSPERAWSLGSLHGATRFGMDNEVGGLGGGRRADLVLLDDNWKPQSTWYGGALVVERRRVTPLLDAALEQRYRYPAAAYTTVTLPEHVALTPALPQHACTANLIRTALPGITLAHERLALEPGSDWPTLLAAHDLCFVSVVERHGRAGGAVAHGLLQGFGLRDGAVASSVGHDSHNIIVAGSSEADMQVALAAVAAMNGGVCVVRSGVVTASVPLPIAGLLSDKRVMAVADEVKALKAAWDSAGCTLPYMGFNLIPLSVIPDIRITDKGIVLVPAMTIIPLFE
ncbi:adenine deaminase C-terminal domain-containing protein [Lichenihabitans sp. Uapishka_5]|uniref:adenine deaminase n=1 Tax=Lichenihabitans sp. Uapishka_5 TaxID=3037302 RepID=UPI0029E82839|nr:adenine deaminase C-terminal domain-containing protein [Lichenihabitans sp. Uapishka_5]MDX7952185.1 adenine deaminase C-terminal domain-containing protein [Lichenihabitans sp. Uapishka_5]